MTSITASYDIYCRKRALQGKKAVSFRKYSSLQSARERQRVNANELLKLRDEVNELRKALQNQTVTTSQPSISNDPFDDLNSLFGSNWCNLKKDDTSNFQMVEDALAPIKLEVPKIERPKPILERSIVRPKKPTLYSWKSILLDIGRMGRTAKVYGLKM